MHTKKELGNIKGVSEAKVDKMLEAVRKLLPDAGFMSGTMALQKASPFLFTHHRSAADTGLSAGLREYPQRAQQCVRMSTGCSAVNEILGGGIETMVS